MPTKRAAWLGGCLLAACALVGCSGSNLADVKGTIQFDGKPIDKGVIDFFSNDGKTPTGGCPIKDGEYSTKVPIGLMKVTIRWPKVVGKQKLYDNPDSPEKPIFAESLPDRLSNRDKSELTLDVQPGLNEKHWDLHSD